MLKYSEESTKKTVFLSKTADQRVFVFESVDTVVSLVVRVPLCVCGLHMCVSMSVYPGSMSPLEQLFSILSVLGSFVSLRRLCARW